MRWLRLNNLYCRLTTLWMISMMVFGITGNAQTKNWLDPDFEEAVRSAALICTGQVQTSQTNKIAVTVGEVLKGIEKTGNTIIVQQPKIIGEGGFHLPPGRDFLFILLPKGTGYAAYTQSYWSFYLTDTTVYMPIRDPVSYIHINRKLFTEFLSLYLAAGNRKQRDEFVTACMQKMAATDPFTKELADVEFQMFALESLCHLRSGADPNFLKQYLLSPYYQVRWSAIRALATCNDISTNDIILSHLRVEDTPHVLSELGKILYNRPVPGAREVLCQRIPQVSMQTIRLAARDNNPVFNTIPSARASLSAALMHIEKQNGTYDELIEKYKDYVLKHTDMKVDPLDYARIFHSMEDALRAPDSVEVLSLYGSDLNYFPKEIIRFTGLQRLSIEKNEIAVFPGFLANFHLHHLEMGYNGLIKVPEVVYTCKELKKLDLRSNEIPSVDASMFALHELVYLDLSENRLTGIPDGIGNLDNLQYLNLSHNNLPVFPEGITQLELLKTLDVSYNSIDSIPGSIGKLTYIEKLMLQGTRIRFMPEEIWEMSRLKFLDVRGTLLDEEEIEKIKMLIPPGCQLLTGEL